MTENRERASRTTLLLIYLIGFCFLWEQSRRIRFPSYSELLSWIRIAELVLLGAVLFRKPWKENRWYFVMIMAVCLIILTSWHRSPKVLEQTKDTFSKIILVLLLCPAIGCLVQGRSLKTFFRVLSAIWTILIVGLCIAGIYAASRNIHILSYNGKRFIGLDNENCLVLWDSYRNTSGILLALSIMVSFIGAAMAEKRWLSVLYLVAAVPMIVCLALTGCRSGIIGMCIGSGAAMATILQKTLNTRIRLKWLKWLVSLLLAAIIAGICLVGTEGVRRGFNHFARQGGSIVPAAKAQEMAMSEEEAAEEAAANIAERDYFSGSLSGREDLWKSALEALRKRPKLLITGTSIHTVMEDLSKLVPTYDLPQLHNEFLQILVSTGIFGAALFIAFLFFAVRAAFRLITETGRTLWERLMYLPFLCLFLVCQVEAIGINAHPDLVGLVMIFTGAAIGITGAGEKNGVKRERRNLSNKT